MKTPIDLAAIFLIVLACNSCATPPVGDQGRDLNQEFGLSAREFAVAKERAIHGDGQSSYRLSQHFMLGTGDATEAFFWLTLSAEQGNCSALTEFRSIYSSGGTSVRNAKRFAEQAESNCSAAAK